jgi:transposase, IS605 OrfB family, central region
MIFNGSQFIKYNCFYNKQLSKLNTEISKEVVSNREVKTKNGDNIKIPTAYNMAGRHLIKKRSQLHECRNRYFESEMHKISKKLLTHLKHNGVTDLYLSTNLSFTKETGKIKMRKASKQQFYQIPFGRLLNNIKAKAAMFGINYHDVDEAYTSKTSCLTRDVLLNQMKKLNKEVVTLDDLNGSRGVKGSKLGRGMYKDRELNIVFNSDLNGAANHIKIGCNVIDLSIYRNHLWKLANPVKIKSTNEFDVLLKNIK